MFSHTRNCFCVPFFLRLKYMIKWAAYQLVIFNSDTAPESGSVSLMNYRLTSLLGSTFAFPLLPS